VRVAVVGDGVAAALAATVLARAGVPVLAVPTGTGGTGLGPFGPAVIGLPDWQATALAAALGPVPGQSFALGVAFGGWAAERGDWFWPFGDSGAPLGTLPFPQVVARLRAQGQSVALADYALAALAARAERFAPPSADPRSPLSTLAVGVHYPADALAATLRRLAPVRTTPPINGVAVAEGRVAALRLADGATIAADLYVDATGEAAHLLSALGSRWESWRDWLPCNRADATAAPDPRTPPYALHVADPDGWTATVPLDGVRATTRFSVDGPGVAYDSGVRPAAWTGNCVGIGAAAGLVEPVLGTPLLLAHNAAQRLLNLLPHAADHAVEAAEYNRLTAAEHARTRDGAVALWATNGRAGEPVWDRQRDRAPPELDWKLRLYRSRGRVPLLDDEPLSRADWFALLDGQGLRARRLDPQGAAVSDDAVAAHAARLRDRLADTVRRMPRYADQLARIRQAR
jgi:tryptophan 7-halogenase